MSSTLNTQEMVRILKRKFPLGLTNADAIDFLNEAFRKINQAQKGGFIWQVKTTTLTIPAAVSPPDPTLDIALPSDFDPGKSAWLYGRPGTAVPTATLIPYQPFQQFQMQENFSTNAVGQFSAWSFRPAFTAAVPHTTGYVWVLNLKPFEAFPLVVPLTLDFKYHSCSYATVVEAVDHYFPTPGQFDSLIIDLAIAEYGEVYGKANWQAKRDAAMQGVNEIIDTYRTDRYDLSGISDLAIQIQERQSDKTK